MKFDKPRQSSVANCVPSPLKARKNLLVRIFKSDGSSTTWVLSNNNVAALILPMMSMFGAFKGTTTVPFECAQIMTGRNR